MNKVWGHRGQIAVEHPSGWKLVGRRDVMHSWARLMVAPPDINCIVEGISFAKDTATVYCDEQLNPGSARMKNIFHRGGWRLEDNLSRTGAEGRDGELIDYPTGRRLRASWAK